MPSNARNLANLLGTGETQISADKLGADVPPGTEDYSDVDSLGVGTTIGETAFVQGSNRMYIWNGSGWYNIALINTSPTWDSGGQPSASYTLDADSPQDATVITLAASDPEGLPISYTHVTSGSMDSMATISQDSSVFTITPKTVTEVGEGVELTGSITFRASDGVNILPYVSSFTLSFVSIIENSRYTTLLATAVGTTDNNDITDSSTNNHSITVNGDAHAGTFSPYRSRGYSTHFQDTAANVLYTSPSTDFAFGTGAFTISVWVKILHAFGGTIFDTNDGTNVGATMEISGTNFSVHSGTSYTQLASISSSNQDVWQHFCWTRDGSGNNKIFVNGTQSTTFTDSTNYTSQNFKMGERQNGTQDLKAYVKDLHIVKGYVNEPDSTYADGAAEAGTGTVFLGCSLPYHGDKSSSPKTLTVANSGISIVNDTPHNYLEYSASDHGGSVYFDGASDYLSTTVSTIGTGAFTFECWANFETLASNEILFSMGAYSPALYYRSASSELAIYHSSAFYTTGFTPQTNTWYHIAMVRESNGNIKVYINGEQKGTTQTYTTDITNTTCYIGYDTTTAYYEGWISDARLVVGTAVYTANFTPPTAPLSSSGAELHIKGTDASIIDKSQGSNLKLVGNTTGSTTQVKFANTKSMYFDGTGDLIASSPVSFGNSFTAEAWIYQPVTAGNGGAGDDVFSVWNNSNGQKAILLRIDGTSLTLFVSYDGSTNNISGLAGGTINTNTWHHVALTWDGSNYRLFLDGTVVQTQASSTAPYSSTQKLQIGSSKSGTSGAQDGYYQGYIQDARFTSGLARYTANFTPPTEPLKG